MEQTHVAAPSAPVGMSWFARLKRLGIWGQILALAILFILFDVGSGGKFVSFDNLHTIASNASIPIILALGIHQTVIIGGMDLSMEGVVAICGVAVGFLLKNDKTAYDIGFLIIPIVMLMGGAVGLLSGVVHTKMKMPSFIATLGINWIFYGLAVRISGGASVPIRDGRFQKLVTGSDLKWEMGGAVYSIPNITLVALFFWIIFEIFQSRTKSGIAMYAVGGDETLAKQAGINVDRLKILVFTLAGIVYGIAALFLVTRLNSAAARVASLLQFPAMTAVAVGGVSLTGGLGMARNAALGALIISTLNNGMVMMHVNPYIQEAVNGIVLITAVALTIDRKKLGFIK